MSINCLIFYCFIGLTITFQDIKANKVLEVVKTTGLESIYNLIVNHEITESNEILNFLSLEDKFMEIIQKFQYLDHVKDENIKINELIFKTVMNVEKINYIYKNYVVHSNISNDNYLSLLNKLTPITLKSIDTIYANVIGNENNVNSFVGILDNYAEILLPNCLAKESRQRFFYELLLSVLSNELKFYAIVRSTSNENTITRYEIESAMRINSTLTVFKDLMKKTSRDVWRCDAKKQIENETYIELKNVFRRILYDERDFYENTEKFCENACPNIYFSPIPYCKKNSACELSQRACGKVVNCQAITNDHGFDVCVNEKNQGPRYNYAEPHVVSFWNDLEFMFKKNCTGKLRQISSRLPKIMTMQKYCSACNCICDEDTNSDRYFSLSSETSDVELNYVVTGARFVKKNFTVHLRIQQGKLLPLGLIDPKTLIWKNTSDKAETKFKLEYKEKRGLYLDDLKLMKQKDVVTGVRFAVASRAKDQFLKLEIRGTPINETTGRLMVNESYWYSSPDLAERTELNLENLNAPTSVEIKNVIDDKLERFTYFTTTDLVGKEAGQITIPFLDSQPIATKSPLAGLSLGIKRSHSSAGYLVPKLKTQDALIYFN